MGAGLPGTTLTLNGTTSGVFAVDQIMEIEQTQYVIASGPTSSPPQWVVTGTSHYWGPQIVNAWLWRISG